MSHDDDRAHAVPVSPPSGRLAGTQVCVLLAHFAGSTRAANKPAGTAAAAAGAMTEDMISRHSRPGSQRLILRFNPAGDGALLEV